MKLHHVLLLAVCLSLLPAAAAAKQMYYWIDKDGVKRFSNQPPPAGVKIEGTAPEVQSPAEEPASEAAPAVKLQKAEPKDEPAVSEPDPAGAKLLDKRNALETHFGELQTEAQTIQTDRAAVPRRPRSKYRKRQRVINQRAVELNHRITEYNEKRKAFNADPQRERYKLSELPEIHPLIVPKTATTKTTE